MFEYTNVELPDDAVFKISPSSISTFFSNPVTWYKEQVLKEEGFKGNTSSTIGTIVHHCAEMHIKNKKIDKTQINKAVNEIVNDDVDKQEVLSNWETLSDLLYDEYISKNKINEAEKSMYLKVKDGVYLAGTCDALEGSIVVDFKNVGKKPSDDIPFNYFIQLMSYALMYKRNGVFVDRIRLVYTVRATKTIPPRLFVVTKMITEDDWKKIEDTIELIADTILTAKKSPDLVYLLFKSMQFKTLTKAKPVMFNTKENKNVS